jgi:hypothetical protein
LDALHCLILDLNIPLMVKARAGTFVQLVRWTKSPARSGKFTYEYLCI